MSTKVIPLALQLSLLMLCSWCGSAIARNTHIEVCSSPFGTPWNIAELESSLYSSHERVRQEIEKKEAFPSEYSEESLSWSIRHAEWLVTYYQTFNLAFSGNDEEALKNNLSILLDRADLTSVEEGWKILELFQFLDEFSELSTTITPSLYNSIVGRIVQYINDRKEDPKSNPRLIRKSELRLAVYRMHFGNTFFQPKEVADAYDNIAVLISQEQSLPPPFISYLTGYASMVKGRMSGDITELENAAESFSEALSTYDIECNRRLAAKSNYFLMGIYSQIAGLSGGMDTKVRSAITSALTAGEYSRAYASLLDDPHLWRAVHKRSSEIFDMAAQNEYGDDLRRRFEYLSKRSYELAIVY